MDSARMTMTDSSQQELQIYLDSKFGSKSFHIGNEIGNMKVLKSLNPGI